MNPGTVNKLRKKFMMSSLLSFTVVMILMGGAIYGTNLAITRSSIKRIMKEIVRYDGELPLVEHPPASEHESETMQESETDTGSATDYDFTIRDIFDANSDAYSSEDTRYSARYFAVLYDENGEIEEVLTSHIAAVDRDDAISFADQIKDRFFHFGSLGTYYYYVSDRVNSDGTIVVFYDATNQVLTINRVLFTALILIGAGLVIAAFVVRAVSWKIVQPEIKNAEIQKEFITNASHELKTPLAVIRANTEVDQMMNGENEWNQSTMRQVDRMTGLIQNLITISRAQEQKNTAEREKVDLSKVIAETADTFEPLAVQNGKKLEKKIAENVSMLADEGQMRQLTSLLVDNAIKYCDDGGTITVALLPRTRGVIRLCVSNNYAAGKDVDYSLFFERFYREDESHHQQEKGGYGIGLSIAQAIIGQYKGSTINASWKDGIITFTCTLKG